MITEAKIHYDHGVLSALIQLRYTHSAYQGAGLLDLGEKGLGWFVNGVLKAVGVDSWDDLPGEYVWAFIEDGVVKGIRHPILGYPPFHWSNPPKWLREAKE